MISKHRYFGIIIISLLVLYFIHIVIFLALNSPINKVKERFASPKKFQKIISKKDQESITINLYLPSGELDIYPLPAKSSNLIKFNSSYQWAGQKPIIRYQQGKKSVLQIRTKRLRHYGYSLTTKWHLGLSSQVFNSLNINSKIASININLKNIPITHLHIKNQIGKIFINFPSANPTILKQFTLITKASYLNLQNLDNAHIKRAYIQTIASTGYLDYSSKTSDFKIKGHILNNMH